MEVRTRFAPSPTGYMHIGNLRTALYTWLFARSQGGAFVLRIEDTDQEREVQGAVDVIYRSLREVGLTWDEGPDVGGDYGPYVQTQRRDIYRPYAEELVRKGKAYYCFCSKERLDDLRAQSEAQGETFKYDKHCLQLSPEEVQRRIAAGEPYVIRQNVPECGVTSFDDVIYGHIEVENATLDDNVLLKSDGLPTYNFANVVDDHLMGITHILRGTEYLSSTPKYNLLYDAFGWQVPTYVHLPPVMADSHRKLSKRKGDPSFEDLLAMGYLKDAIVNYIALLGWSPGNDEEWFSLEGLVQAFRLEGINKSPSVFDMEKLTWFNAGYIRKLPVEDFHALILPYLEEVLPTGRFNTLRLAELLQPRCEVLPDVKGKVAFLAQLPADYTADFYVNKKQKSTLETSLEVLEDLTPRLAALPSFTEDAIREAASAYIAERGVKNGLVLWPLRIAMAGALNTPGGAYEIGALLGKEETLRRLEAGRTMLRTALTD